MSRRYTALIQDMSSSITLADTDRSSMVDACASPRPSGADQTLAADLAMRVQIEPFNVIATSVFFLAILHTFAGRPRFARLAHRVQHRHDEEARAHGLPATPSLRAEALHFLGEVEVVFGLWAVVLIVATTAYAGGEAARHYVSETVNSATGTRVRRRHHVACFDAARHRVR